MLPYAETHYRSHGKEGAVNICKHYPLQFFNGNASKIPPLPHRYHQLIAQCSSCWKRSCYYSLLAMFAEVARPEAAAALLRPRGMMLLLSIASKSSSTNPPFLFFFFSLRHPHPLPLIIDQAPLLAALIVIIFALTAAVIAVVAIVAIIAIIIVIVVIII